MAEKVWHEKFIKYMMFIINHPNYKGLKIEKKADGSYSWIAPAQSPTGKSRKDWALKKAKELGFKDEPGVYAKVMFAIHPTKSKVCQVCGKTMSLYYVYPNANLVKAIEKEFGYQCDTCTSIYDVVDMLLNEHNEDKVKSFLIKKFNLDSSLQKKPWRELLEYCEDACRNGPSKLMGPGAMSNFPDRFDGFHTYNRCCRSTEDKGRSAENLRTYTKDRRAYEYWSDGNIHAANQYMGSGFFAGTSADHVGPISLGFLHDPLFLRPMPSGDNSSKRDRLQYEDIETIIDIEVANNICGMSWYSKLIWDFIKYHYKFHPEYLEPFWNALKESRNTYMNFLWMIIHYGKDNGIDFCVETLLKPNLHYFEYDYEFGPLGKITKMTKRNVTEATKKEAERYFRIAIQSVLDYHEKENRHQKFKITKDESKKIWGIIYQLKYHKYDYLKTKLIELVKNHENAIIAELLDELKIDD